MFGLINKNDNINKDVRDILFNLVICTEKLFTGDSSNINCPKFTYLHSSNNNSQDKVFSKYHQVNFTINVPMHKPNESMSF